MTTEKTSKFGWNIWGSICSLMCLPMFFNTISQRVDLWYFFVKDICETNLAGPTSNRDIFFSWRWERERERASTFLFFQLEVNLRDVVMQTRITSDVCFSFFIRKTNFSFHEKDEDGNFCDVISSSIAILQSRFWVQSRFHHVGAREWGSREVFFSTSSIF